MNAPINFPRPYPKSYWVLPGKLMGGEYPGSLDDQEALAKIQSVCGCGINSFIDLTQDYELRPYQPLMVDPGLTYQRFPIRDFGIPARADMVTILNALDAALAQGRTVYIHCWGGAGRTGTVIGCYLVRHGMSGAEALQEINHLRRVIPAAVRRSSPESHDQIQMVLDWQPGE